MKKICCIPDITKHLTIFEKTVYAPGVCNYLNNGTCEHTPKLSVIVEAGVYSSAMKDIVKAVTDNCKKDLQHWSRSSGSKIIDFTALEWSPPFTPAFSENVGFILQVPKDILWEIKKALKGRLPKNQKHVAIKLTNLNLVPEALCFFPEEEPYLNAFGKFKYSFGGIQISIEEKERIVLLTPKEIRKVHTHIFKDIRNVLRLKGRLLL